MPLCLVKGILLQMENKAAEVKEQDVEDCLAQYRKKPSNCCDWGVLWGKKGSRQLRTDKGSQRIVWEEERHSEPLSLPGETTLFHSR